MQHISSNDHLSVVTERTGQVPDVSIEEAEAAIRMAFLQAGSHRIGFGPQAVGAFRLRSGREIMFAADIIRDAESLGVVFRVEDVDDTELAELSAIHERICRLVPPMMWAVVGARSGGSEEVA